VAAVAAQELGADLGFQTPDGLAEGRLREWEIFGGSAEAEPLGNRNEVTKVAALGHAAMLSVRVTVSRGGHGVIVSGSALDVPPDTVTVTVALPGWSGHGGLFGGRSNVIDVSLHFVIVSFAPSNGAPQLVPPWARVR
jgi:hypothetical protein